MNSAPDFMSPTGFGRTISLSGRYRASVLAVLALGASLSLLGQSQLGISLIVLATGAFLLFVHPAVFLGLTMGAYGSVQFLLQESFQITLGPAALNASKLFVVAVTGAFSVRVLMSLNQLKIGRSLPKSLVFATLIALWSGLSMLRVYHGSEALAVLARIVACTAAFLFAYVFVRTPRDLLWVWFGGSVAVIVSSGVALFTYVFGDSLGAIRMGAFRAAGGFGGAVATGTVAFFGVGMSLAFLNAGVLGKRAKVIAIAALALGTFGILATFTRTAIVGVIVFAFFYAFNPSDNSQQKLNLRKRLVLLALLAAAFVVAFSFVSEDAIEARISDLPGIGGGSGISAQAGSGRGLIWKSLLEEQLRASPAEWVLGHGLLAVPGVMRIAIGVPLVAHNSYFEALFDSGIIGLALYLAFVFTMVADLRRASLNTSAPFSSLIATWRHYYIAYFLTTVMFNGYLYVIGPRWFSMIISGALLGLARYATSEPERPT